MSKINLKKSYLLNILLIVSSIYSKDISSQTFFMPRGVNENSIIELALQNYRMYHNNYSKDEKPYLTPKDRALLNIQSNYFYKESDNAEAISRYFLLGNKPFLRVKQQGGAGTVASKWLGLSRKDGTFDSTLSISPERTAFGTVLNYHQDLSMLYPGIWASFMLPVVKTEHNLNMEIISKGAEGDASYLRTVIDAFNQEELRYGKFSRLKISKTGLDDIQVKTGFNFTKDQDMRLGVYADLSIPIEGKPSAEYLFGHVLGNGGHIGIGVGSNFEFALADYENHFLSLVGDIKYKYLLPSTEERSFDLKSNGEWSRYLLVSRKGFATQPLPGINFFTRDLKISPRDRAEVLVAMHYNYSDFNLELGYNFWWRNGERVSLRQPWIEDSENIGVFNPFAISLSDASASTATISQSFNDVIQDNQFIRIKESDLDLESSSHKAALTHTFYVGAAMDTIFLDSPWMFGGGLAYEVSKDNTAMNNWSLWLKTCYSF